MPEFHRVGEIAARRIICARRLPADDARTPSTAYVLSPWPVTRVATPSKGRPLCGRRVLLRTDSQCPCVIILNCWRAADFAPARCLTEYWNTAYAPTWAAGMARELQSNQWRSADNGSR